MIWHTQRPVLYVDDTMEQRYAMRRILESNGYAVLEAGTGAEAMQMLAQQPRLAVVDVKLPDINGYELARRMKEREPFLPILQVSASFSDPALRASGLSGGADAYIAQPVHPPELIALVERMLHTRMAEDTLRFLAGLGNRLNASLDLAEASQNICDAMIPFLADRCILYLEQSSSTRDPLWFGEPHDHLERGLVLGATQSTGAVLRGSRMITVPVSAGGQVLGALGLILNQSREYTETDLLIASDFSNRAALTIQNCLLFASEEATRLALIQAEKLATAGRMSAAIAHEINNPLEAVCNLLYILETSPESTESIRSTAASALAEVMRIAHITRQTLGFYRELRRPTSVRLVDSVQEALDVFEKRLADNQIAVELALDESIHIEAVPGEIRQVLSNLLLNALEACPKGSAIKISLALKKGKAELIVDDNGPGIPPESLDRIFEAFFTTKQGTGTGLGLWITQSIVKKHRGTITVDTRTTGSDRGTQFILVFPIT